MYNGNNFNDTSVGLGNTDFANKDIIVPESIKFQPVKRAVAAKRTPVKIRAEQQSYTSSQNKLIRIILPNAAFYDTRSGYLTFDVNLAVTGGTYARIHSGIFSIFNRMRVLAGSTEIEDIRDYNRIYTILWEILNPIMVTGNIGVTTMGFGTQAQRNALTPLSQYACPLYSGVFGTELLPFDNIPNQVVLELYIEDPTACVETDGTLPIITVSNIMFHIERLELEDNYRSYIQSYVNSNGLKLGFHTWERYTQALTTGAMQNVTISQRSSSMNGMLNIFVNSATINTTTVNDRFLNWPKLTLTSTSLLINGKVFPDEPIDTVYANGAEAFQAYLRWVQKWKLNGIIAIAPSLNNTAFNIDRFIQIDDFEAFPEYDDLINPFNTISSNSNLIKKEVFAGLIPANYQLDSWIEYFKQVCIYKNGEINVIQ